GGNSGNGSGTVFKINTSGSGFTVLYSFPATSGPFPPTNNVGAAPLGVLSLSGNTLYGNAFHGGTSGLGTVYSLTLPPPPQLAIVRSAANVVLTWTTNATGFTLQSATNLISPAKWSDVFPGPVLVNGQNAVTNSISGT